MSKKKDTFINMVVSLFAITIVSGFALGYVNDLTVGPIEQAKITKKVDALKMVLPEFDNNPVAQVLLINSEFAKDSVEVYPAFKNNEFVGAAVIGSTEKGFSGLIKIMVGFMPDGTIKNIAVLEQKETPGLGTKMKDEKFLAQFREKNPSTYNLKVTKDGGEVDALTGATISSRAFGEAVQMAYDEFLKNNDALIKLKN
ncbi:RnfABCDGE type electron transport complex subunit G [Lutibacter sp. A80]|uniref:RnfABCDGE type electron transport complex subunit G n=1 Tax=Lutibacter sp. A80 TaxID=2918453 RepID=UPI001F058372|nr:RnfABCDGE type electron transport complex subunit G [Lutibacter sp. A80]UMB60150.1 RnfABCDGE type electron transport complex subunit G [Lutibacter sp. A80]